MQRCGPQRPRKGSVLVEFALIALALTLVLAATIDLGRAVHGAQALQAAADLAAHELARTPLPAGMTFDQALAQPDVMAKLYSEDYLVVDLDSPSLPPESQWPLINQQLRPLMIYDQIDGHRLLRYPGAMVPGASPFAPYKFAGIYQVTYNPQGFETIDLTPLKVIEEIRTTPSDPTTGPFALTGAATPVKQGYVAVRVNYPFQAATLSSYFRNPQDPLNLRGEHQQVIEAGDPVDPATLEASGQLPLYSGPEGLGQQYALGKTVRPFRKILSAQAIYRREVFTANPGTNSPP